MAAAVRSRPLPIGGPVKVLPPKTRLSYKDVSCGTDGAGVTACVNSLNQTGFVISPAGGFTFGEAPALLDRPPGTSPFQNGF
jgi:hypothetical protein